MNILHQAQVKLHKKEKPGFFGEGGWLFLTENKLVFAKTGMSTIYKTLYNEKDLEKFYNKGKIKLEIPLSDIIEAAADSKIGAPYLTIKYRSQKGEEVLSFQDADTSRYLFANGHDYNYWVEAIHRLKKTSEKLAPPPPPPPPPFQT